MRQRAGSEDETADHLEEIVRRNGGEALAEPHVAGALTRQQSTFTRQDLARFVDRHGQMAEQFSAVK